jgi:hypothetical protein
MYETLITIAQNVRTRKPAASTESANASAPDLVSVKHAAAPLDHRLSPIAHRIRGILERRRDARRGRSAPQGAHALSVRT